MDSSPKRRFTRNRMGWISEELSTVSRMFVASCGPGMRVLDIGAGFGVASLAAIGAGAHAIANDLDPGHLDVLFQRATEEQRSRLELKLGRFPREVHFEPETFGAVHASSVFHFLSGNQLQDGLRAITRWLVPGGQLFVQAATPFQAPFHAFIPEYERRVGAGQRWPGWIEKISMFSTHRQLGQMPRSMHLLDDRVLARAMGEAGLVVEQAFLFRRHDFPVSLALDGRESVGVVARRPFPEYHKP